MSSSVSVEWMDGGRWEGFTQKATTQLWSRKPPLSHQSYHCSVMSHTSVFKLCLWGRLDWHGL